MSKAAIGMEEPSAQAKHGLRKTVLAVAASFFGVRGSKEHEADMAQLKPLHVIAVGLIDGGDLCFIAGFGCAYGCGLGGLESFDLDLL